MQIQIDGKSIASLSPEQEAQINLGHTLPSVSARVLTLASATDRASKLTRFLVATHVGLATVVISSIVISLLIMSTTEAQLLILGACIVLEVIVISMALIIGRGQRQSWVEHLEASLPLLPPQGTAIHLDETALTLGDRRFHRLRVIGLARAHQVYSVSARIRSESSIVAKFVKVSHTA